MLAVARAMAPDAAFAGVRLAVDDHEKGRRRQARVRRRGGWCVDADADANIDVAVDADGEAAKDIRG